MTRGASKYNTQAPCAKLQILKEGNSLYIIIKYKYVFVRIVSILTYGIEATGKQQEVSLYTSPVRLYDRRNQPW